MRSGPVRITLSQLQANIKTKTLNTILEETLNGIDKDGFIRPGTPDSYLADIYRGSMNGKRFSEYKDFLERDDAYQKTKEIFERELKIRPEETYLLEKQYAQAGFHFNLCIACSIKEPYMVSIQRTEIPKNPFNFYRDKQGVLCKETKITKFELPAEANDLDPVIFPGSVIYEFEYKESLPRVRDEFIFSNKMLAIYCTAKNGTLPKPTLEILALAAAEESLLQAYKDQELSDDAKKLLFQLDQQLHGKLLNYVEGDAWIESMTTKLVLKKFELFIEAENKKTPPSIQRRLLIENFCMMLTEANTALKYKTASLQEVTKILNDTVDLYTTPTQEKWKAYESYIQQLKGTTPLDKLVAGMQVVLGVIGFALALVTAPIFMFPACIDLVSPAIEYTEKSASKFRGIESLRSKAQSLYQSEKPDPSKETKTPSSRKK